ncbi:SpoIIE family protein phosphatase [Planosporangium sp. 12N6]|uniref:SpoIIE family protein phosphatase n=1 Tax=Planosporangium spinosum TaxID=3402278 RepID=UPI003CF9F07E
MDSAERQPVPAAGVDVFTVDDEVGPDLATVDWAATPLGPTAGWPQSLRTSVSILLSSRFPMWMAWGPQLTFFCNAAYRRDTLGRKYPWALGRPASEVWAEIWGDIGPRIETVLTTGKATWDEGLLLFLERSGFREETYHTFSYSPLRDEAGALTGMLCVVTEDTERVVGERRMATLRDLGSDPSVVRTEQEMLAFAAQQLGRNLRDLPFTLTYLFGDDGRAELAAATGIAAGHPAAPPILAADHPAGVWPAARLAGQEPVLVDLDDSSLPGLPSGDWPDPPAQALLVPLVQQGAAPYGFLVAALNPYRPLDQGYRGFVELAAGHVAAGIGSARNYQAQQRRAEELAELDRAKTAFFSNISHEFRTPLTLILGPVQELRERLAADDQRARDEVDAIHRNSLRLGKLVNTLLDFSRIEAGRVQARYEPVRLPAFTAELASVFRAAVEKAGLTFEVDCPPLDEPVYVDRSMWEKVVLNLLSNALKFTFAGSIRVSVRAEDGRAVVEVADTGIGVPAEEMPRLFERFHRIPQTRSRSNEGSGIGLALVKELVELHGGTITATSAPGVGTTFTVRLPFGSAHLPEGQVATAAGADAVSATAEPFVQEALRWLPGDPAGPGDGDDPGAASRRTTKAAPGPQGRPARVLVADDNADMREYLRRLLGDRYDATTVSDGHEALVAARADRPDLIVSDVMMPGMDGLELVAALRADPRTASVPVMLLSARAGEEAAIEGLTAGADDYLVKPFSADELRARVRATIDLSKLRNHHAQWRHAMINSLQEGFFVVDENGAVIEINKAFTHILGYRADDLPYPAPQPWWPDESADPEAYRAVTNALGEILDRPNGSFMLPLRHRDGHRLWAAVNYNAVADDAGHRMVVGTIRDVTAEHYTVQREAALSSLNRRLSQAGSTPEVLGAALDELRRCWHAHRAVAVRWDSSRDRHVTASPGMDGDQLPPDIRAMVEALREQPALRVTIDPADGLRPTGVGTTIEAPDGPLVLWLELDPARGFGTHDQTLLLLLAGSVGQALHRAYAADQQTEVALALQRSILGPAQLPDGFAVRYQPASRPLQVGGDWYDAVDLDDGRIGIVVGDCVGRGLSAATVMGQLRSACRALLLQAASPAEALTALDRFAAKLPGALCTTVFCGILDPDSGELAYSSAGHPPAILTHPDGHTELLEGGRGGPLGIGTRKPRPSATCLLPPRSVLLLYTDGLVERRRRALETGITQAADAVREHLTLNVEQLADHVMNRMSTDGGHDDVALLVYRHPAPLELSFPAEAAQLASARSALRRWLRRAGVDPMHTQDIIVAAGEACANAIEHGHRDAPYGEIRLQAAIAGNDLQIVVIDTGTWRPPTNDPNSHRGRGLTLMHALMQHVAVATTSTGTTVTMQTRIPA